VVIRLPSFLPIQECKRGAVAPASGIP